MQKRAVGMRESKRQQQQRQQPGSLKFRSISEK
nr:MAG TPA: hypothetical protein [Caudoviricetes sp.]DAY54391.1 MAG TPA: hypothetical protein [Caudoviricetes sp.]